MNPLEEQSTIERWRIRWRLRRAWRRGAAERDARTLGRLASITGNDLVVRAEPTVAGPLSVVGEVTFSSGTTVRMSPCSQAVLRRLAELARDHVAVLGRAANHGRFWGLYFDVAGQRIGILAREIRLAGGHGGLRLASPTAVLPA